MCVVKWKARVPQDGKSSSFHDGYKPKDTLYLNSEIKEKGHSLLLCNFYEKVVRVQNN